MAIFNEDNNPVGLSVSSNMKAREACHKLALLNKVDDDPHWVLTEYLTDLGLGKYISLTGISRGNITSVKTTNIKSTANSLLAL